MNIHHEFVRLKIQLAQNADTTFQADTIVAFLKINIRRDHLQSLPYIELLAQLAEKNSSAYQRAWALYFKAYSQYCVGNYEASEELTKQVLVLFEQLNEKNGLAYAYSNLGGINERTGNFSEALKNDFAALAIRTETGDKLGMAISYNNIGVVYQLHGNYVESLKSHLASIKLKDEIGEIQGKSSSYLNIGLIHSNNGNYPEALKSYFAALEISEEDNFSKGIADALNNIGTMLSTMGNMEEALDYHLKSLNIRQELDDRYGLAFAYRNIGQIYQVLGKFDESMENHLHALHIRQAIGDQKGIANSLHAIGFLLQLKGDLPALTKQQSNEYLKEALLKYEEALQIAKAIDDKRPMAYYYNSIGEVYKKQGDYPKAIKELKTALQLGESVGDQALIKECCLLLSESFQSFENFASALEFYEKYYTIEKQLNGEQAKKQLTNLSFQHNLEQKEKEAEIERIKNVELKEALEKLKREQLRSEQLFQHQVQDLKSSALQAQMNPHFVFNSLNAIQQFIWEKEPEEATAYLSRFSKLIRAVLNNSLKQFISLEDDLTTLEYYIELEALRFENKFEYRIECDPLIDKKQLQLPPMIIQPFAENAIVHGLQPLQSQGKLNIRLEQKEDEILLITIEDNGVGRDRASEIKRGNGKSHHSLAMELTRERLEKMNSNLPSEEAIVIIDLFNELQKPTGTRVQIKVKMKDSATNIANVGLN